MKKWTIKINEYAENRLLAMNAYFQYKFLHVIDLLEELGPKNIGLPHVRHVNKKIWEVRLKCKYNITNSMYLSCSNHKIVILMFHTRTLKNIMADIHTNLITFDKRQILEDMKEFNKVKKEILKNPYVEKLYREHIKEFEISHALIMARSKSNMTQDDVAKKMKTSQAKISLLESGDHIPKPFKQ